MRRRSRLISALPSLALPLTASLAVGLTIAPAAHATATAAAPTNTCGGAPADYTGLLSLDTPFIGTVTLPGGGTYSMTITPTTFAANDLITVDVTASPTETRSALSRFTLNVDPLGRGGIVFAAPKGQGYKGYSTGVFCTTGTRVTKITGLIPVTGVTGSVSFNVSRT